MTEHTEQPLTLRVGRTVGRTLYHVNPDGTETLIGVVDTRELAAAIVAAVNQARPIAQPPPGPPDIPDDQADAIINQAMHDDDIAHAAYRVGYAAALGYHITVEDNRVHIGDRTKPATRCPHCGRTSHGFPCRGLLGGQP